MGTGGRKRAADGRVRFERTAKQRQFMEAGQDEVLFGGAAGGGKSFAQLLDAFTYALRYPKSKQLVLRRTYPELEKSLIRVSLGLYPEQVYRYNSSTHTGYFVNGSVLDFGYCDSENDVYKYQSAEYDVIRFDELTHFSESMYLYLMSRLRGANGYPKQVKSSTNPGGTGHGWVKERFIDAAPPGQTIIARTGTRVFIPSRVDDNVFLMRSDPGYKDRLRNLPEHQRRALLDGEWEIFEGQFFSEFRRSTHVIKPFCIPEHWRVYRTIDYGLDMLACYWIAVDEEMNGVVFKEIYQSGLIISDAARLIREGDKSTRACRDGGHEGVMCTVLAPPDLWNRRQETGKSAADIFFENGIQLIKTNNSRADGWLAVKEWLKPVRDGQGNTFAKLRIFEGCTNLIRTLPALVFDAVNPNDVCSVPHELTHAPDALRGFCIYWTQPAANAAAKKRWSEDMLEDYEAADENGKAVLRRMWGDKN